MAVGPDRLPSDAVGAAPQRRQRELDAFGVGTVRREALGSGMVGARGVDDTDAHQTRVDRVGEPEADLAGRLRENAPVGRRAGDERRVRARGRGSEADRGQHDEARSAELQ